MSLTKKVYLTISGYDIKLSDNLTFYQKDQLKLIFYINEYGIDYENNATTRALMPVNPLNAILFIENPDGVDSVSSAKIEDNAVTFYLDSTHTQYVGISRMQLRLFDQDGCAITLPHFTFEIRENIYGSGDVRFKNVVMVDQTGTVILTEDNDMLDVGDILTIGPEVPYPQVTKTIKELPVKRNLDGTEKLIVEDNEATKQAPLTTIVDEIKQNSQEKIREIESELAQTNAQLSIAVLNPKMFGAKGDGATDDLQAFNDMVAYGKENGVKHIKVLPGDYKLSDTFYLPSGWTLEGNGKVVIRQETKDSPVIATEEWKLGDGPHGETKVLGINVRGGVGLNNHGLLIFDYYTTVDRVYVNGVGGRGIFFTSKDSNGAAPSGTLVENTITNCHVRRTGDTCIYLGENNNNKITDGIIQNCMISGSIDVGYGLYIGSSAGWFVDNIHTYGKPNVAISLKNSFYTTINNIYIEDFLQSAIAMHIQNTLSASNVSIRLNKDIENGVDVIVISKSSLDVGVANCVINNLNMITSAFSNTVNGVYINTNTVRCSISNYNVVGKSPSQVTKIKGTKTNLNYLESFMVEKPIAESRYNLVYDDKKLKYCDSAKFAGSAPVSLTFKLQDILNYGKIMCDIVICGCAYDNGTLLTSYTSKVMVSAKDNTQDEWRVYAISESVKTGFTTEPTFSVNKLTGELTVTFTPSDDRNTGVVAIDFVSI